MRVSCVLQRCQLCYRCTASATSVSGYTLFVHADEQKDGFMQLDCTDSAVACQTMLRPGRTLPCEWCYCHKFSGTMLEHNTMHSGTACTLLTSTRVQIQQLDADRRHVGAFRHCVWHCNSEHVHQWPGCKACINTQWQTADQVHSA
jgi:hypothetical protein